MTLAGRSVRYLCMWTRLHEICNLGLKNRSPEQLVKEIFQFGGVYFAPVQVESEILEALRELCQLRPKYIVEIGTASGGTMFLWARIADAEATIVTIDLPGGRFGGGSSFLRVPMFRRFALPAQSLHIIRGDSHDPRTFELTKNHLRGNAADFLFIDADHTESGVRSDYAMYSQLVRKGGVIAFHDIAIRNPEYGVHTVWSELKAQHRTREIIGAPVAYGIGLLYV